MVVGDLVEYLKEHLELGYNINDLKLQLVSYGHSPKIVDEALDVLRVEALDSLPSPNIPQQMPSTAHIWLLAPAVLFVLLFSIGVIVNLLKNPAI